MPKGNRNWQTKWLLHNMKQAQLKAPKLSKTILHDGKFWVMNEQLPVSSSKCDFWIDRLHVVGTKKNVEIVQLPFFSLSFFKDWVKSSPMQDILYKISVELTSAKWKRGACGLARSSWKEKLFFTPTHSCGHERDSCWSEFLTATVAMVINHFLLPPSVSTRI